MKYLEKVEQSSMEKTDQLAFSRDSIKVSKAQPNDLQEIYQIACSVGQNKKVPTKGFLMDDYSSDPKFYQAKLLRNIFELKCFYVARSKTQDKILGFLMLNTREEWLSNNPGWIEEVYWNPRFDMSKTDNFVFVDKTAIYAPYIGRGIGSVLFLNMIEESKKRGVNGVFAETIVGPEPNLASLAFKAKQKYVVAGMRYELHEEKDLTTLVHYKAI
ncbi:MAG: GNAT family N-acetyltransferase [Clostridiales bacterium]|nr:GNAT family N-acetyltransferase [Clostridiales bacterium]